MKKLIAILLAVALMATLSVTAFAANEHKGVSEGSHSIGVNGKYNDGDEAAPTVSVDITWGAMEFTYSAGGKTWHPESHTETTDNGTWTANGNNITVTNHSNVGITATFGSNLNSGVKGKFYDANTNGNEVTTVTLNRAEVGSSLTSQQKTVYFNITEGTITGEGSLGTITVTIAKVSAPEGN